MKKKHVHITECNQGDILAQGVYNKDGLLMIAENTVINDKILDKLIDLDIADVLIIKDDDTGEPDNKNISSDYEGFHRFKSNYTERVQDVKYTLDCIASGKDMSFHNVELISESLFSEVMNNRRIIKYICQIKDKDRYTYLHSINVSIYTMMMGKWLGLSDGEIKDLITAGVLHDIGKLVIPHTASEDNRLLSLLEAREMKNHSIYSYQIVQNMPDISERVRQAILMHHESENGGGYPLKLNGEKINYFAKILSVANIYDNLIMNKSGEISSPFEALKQLEKMGFGYFDVKVIAAFLNNIIDYYKGSRVVMSDGSIGEVIAILPNNISCPIVKTDKKFIFTSTNNEVKIIEVSDEAS